MCIRNSAQPSIKPIENTHNKETKKKIYYINETQISRVEKDCIARTTYKIRVILLRLNKLCKKTEKTKLYRIITGTTQPAHLLTLLAVATISCLINSEKNESRSQPSPILNLIYLGSVSAHFGTQLWMSFISGFTLYFSLPRRIFGKVQRALFPKYFLVNAILSLISLSIYLKHNNGNLVIPQVRFQVCRGRLRLNLSTNDYVTGRNTYSMFLIELVVRLYLTPPLLRYMRQATEYEEEAGVGMEIGRHQPGILTQNKEYLQVYRSFRKLHMVIAIGNIVTLACSVVHLHYLSNKLTFS